MHENPEIIEERNEWKENSETFLMWFKNRQLNEFKTHDGGKKKWRDVVIIDN